MTENHVNRVTVKMSVDEAWAALADAHTGIFTSLRADGAPVSLPVWYASVDRKVYLSTRGKKLQRISRNPVASFLVEGGEHWSDLWAVHLTGHAQIIDPSEELSGRISTEIDRKYSGFRTPPDRMPAATRDHYDASRWAVVEFSPNARVISWNNKKLGVA